MANNTSVGKCETCGQFYCLECSGDHFDYGRFCSLRCEQQAEEEKREKEQGRK